MVALAGVPASMAGAELTGRVPRRRLIVAVMLLSVVASLAILPAALTSWSVLVILVLAYSALISGDSAALTSGIVAVAPAASRGTAMAIYSTLGFAAASAGTFAIGLTLDLLGGQSLASWLVAFALMSAPNLIGPPRYEALARELLLRKARDQDVHVVGNTNAVDAVGRLQFSRSDEL
jgi:MFS family permease